MHQDPLHIAHAHQVRFPPFSLPSQHTNIRTPRVVLLRLRLFPQHPPPQAFTNTTKTPLVNVYLVIEQGENAYVNQGHGDDYDDDDKDAEGEYEGRRIHGIGDVV